MTSLAEDIANAVKTAIAESDVADRVTPEVSYLPAWTLAELTNPKAVVMPRAVAMTPHTRTEYANDVQVQIGIVQRVAKATLSASVGALLLLTEEIAEALKRERLDLPDNLKATPIAVEIPTLYSTQHLDQRSVFFSILSLTYRVIR